MSSVLRLAGFLLVLVIAACGSSSTAPPTSSGSGPTLMQGFNPGPAPAAGTGIQIVLPIVDNIQPGDSTEMCTWTDQIMTQDTQVKASEGWQTVSGHHIVIFYTTEKQPAGTSRVCNDDDMASFRYTVAAVGEGAAPGINSLPGDLVVTIPKGAQIVVNHHYLNVGTTVLSAQSAMNILFNPPNTPSTESGAIAFVDTSLKIPPGSYGMDIHCTMQQDVPNWRVIPHMHQWGTHIKVDWTTAANATTTNLFDLIWDPEYAFNPPTTVSSESQPFQMHKGDSIDIHCDYNNTTGSSLVFGQEMCVVFGQTVDPGGTIGDIACDGGDWTGF